MAFLQLSIKVRQKVPIPEWKENQGPKEFEYYLALV